MAAPTTKDGCEGGRRGRVDVVVVVVVVVDEVNSLDDMIDEDGVDVDVVVVKDPAVGGGGIIMTLLE